MKGLNFKFVLVLVALISATVRARPNFNSRVKRVSDTHLQDLETKLALTKLKGFTITLPVAGGKDLDRIGRKRRSQSRAFDILFDKSEEDNIESQPMTDLLNDIQSINALRALKNKHFSRFQPTNENVDTYEPIRQRLEHNEPINVNLYKDYDEDPLNYGLRIK